MKREGGKRQEEGAEVEGSYCLPGSVVALPQPGGGGGRGEHSQIFIEHVPNARH